MAPVGLDGGMPSADVPAPEERSIDVARLRAQTPGCENVIHLNNAGSALPPAVVTQAQIEHLRLEEAIGGYEAHARVQDRVQEAYASIARLLGCRYEQIALMESATAAWDRAFAAIVHTRGQGSSGLGPIGLGPSSRILLSGSEYASNALPALQLARRNGVRVEFIPDGPDGATDPAAVVDMLDEDVAIVAVNHCPSQNGLVNDVAGIGTALRAAGSTAWYLVDACQSVGQLPVNLDQIGADALSATGRKFLRGPRGTGFLALSDRALAELEPFPLDLHGATWESDGYAIQPTARRFEQWEKSYASILGLAAAVDYALDCGIETLGARIEMLSSRLREGLGDIDGVRVRDRGSLRSGIVTFDHTRLPAAELAPAIKAAGVNVSLSTPDYSRVDFDAHGISGLIRVSPHAYNTEAEIDAFLDILPGLVRG